MTKIAKNTICLWYDDGAENAARFYAETFPDSFVGAVHRAPGDNPSGKEGAVLVVEFTVLGVACIGLNGGPAFKYMSPGRLIIVEAMKYFVARGVTRFDLGIGYQNFKRRLGAKEVPLYDLFIARD